MPLTSDDVHNMAFSKSPIGKTGYRNDEVDAFLDRVATELQRPQVNGLASVEVEDVRFSSSSRLDRGYDQDEVDSFIDLVAEELARRKGRPLVSRSGPTELAAEPLELTGEPDPKPSRLRGFFAAITGRSKAPEI